MITNIEIFHPMKKEDGNIRWQTVLQVFDKEAGCLKYYTDGELIETVELDKKEEETDVSSRGGWQPRKPFFPPPSCPDNQVCS